MMIDAIDFLEEEFDMKISQLENNHEIEINEKIGEINRIMHENSSLSNEIGNLKKEIQMLKENNN